MSRHLDFLPLLAVPPSIINTGNFLNVFAGDSITLVCSYQGYPTPESSWCKLNNDSECQDIDQSTCSNWTAQVFEPTAAQAGRIEFQIPAVRHCDDGMYQCNATNLVIPSGVQSRVQLNVIRKYRGWVGNRSRPNIS